MCGEFPALIAAIVLAFKSSYEPWYVALTVIPFSAPIVELKSETIESIVSAKAPLILCQNSTVTPSPVFVTKSTFVSVSWLPHPTNPNDATNAAAEYFNVLVNFIVSYSPFCSCN